jgi:hypothetical protein
MANLQPEGFYLAFIRTAKRKLGRGRAWLQRTSSEGHGGGAPESSKELCRLVWYGGLGSALSIFGGGGRNTAIAVAGR